MTFRATSVDAVASVRSHDTILSADGKLLILKTRPLGGRHNRIPPQDCEVHLQQV